MPIQTYTLPDSLQFVVRVVPSEDDPSPYDAQVLAGLSDALPEIERSASDRSVYYQTLSIAPPPRKGLLGLRKSGNDWTPPSEIDPWNDDTRDFWLRVGRNPDLHQPIRRWLEDVLRMLDRVNRLSRSTEGLWEYDEAAFAEPAISVLAMAHPDFVPFYTRFLTVWDMHHEVSQHDVILQLFEVHGVTNATEDLIIVRTADGIGQAGHDTFDEVFPLLQDHYGDLKESDFLKRMVAYHHAHAVSAYAHHLGHQFEYYKRDMLQNRQAQQPEVPHQIEPTFLAGHPELSSMAKPLLEELERKRLAVG